VIFQKCRNAVLHHMRGHCELHACNFQIRHHPEMKKQRSVTHTLPLKKVDCTGRTKERTRLLFTSRSTKNHYLLFTSREHVKQNSVQLSSGMAMNAKMSTTVECNY
jgi:hypothetical protein